ncbi:Chromosome (plasmid) partitioning protein ParB [Deinococcus marmoris]|uniref:Chromosome (Plasmid) partitioning protein ParB n=1 Tax=Deinococcus marmoris TaxID=249408 RepID=A0A1U7NW96_9DEIO|nr:Chromosome (plasmid) partitioning protein ParB [Deinococcus marmoris]
MAAEAGWAVTKEVTSLPVTLLRPGTGQPRRAFDPVKLEQLASSIRERGMLQPLLVRPVGESYEIVAGERRWRAAQQAGLQEVPVLVRDLTPEEARQLALIENLQREDLNAVDEVDAKLALVALALGVTPVEARTRLLQMLREASMPGLRPFFRSSARRGPTLPRTNSGSSTGRPPFSVPSGPVSPSRWRGSSLRLRLKHKQSCSNKQRKAQAARNSAKLLKPRPHPSTRQKSGRWRVRSAPRAGWGSSIPGSKKRWTAGWNRCPKR